MSEWVDVAGWEGLYQVSSQGQVRSLTRIDGGGKTRHGRILKQYINTAGYPSVSLAKDGKKQTALVHRLVAIGFLPMVPSKDQVNHKNGNRGDSKLENLEWVTCSENHKHAFRELGKKPRTPRKPVIGTKGNETIMFESTCAAEAFGFDHIHISNCCRGKEKTHKGYTWRFLDA